MENRNTGGGIGDALRMLEAFESVGVRFLAITHTDIDQQRRGFRPKESIEEARRSMPFLVPSSRKRRNNVILRPHRPLSALLIQLDDLNEAALDRVKPVAFLILQTSPGNFQAWLAVESPENAPGRLQDADLVRRVRKAAGADPTASGAARTAGTANYKRKYEPDFPIVRITSTQPGLIVTRDALERLGLVAAPETPPVLRASAPARRSRRTRGAWPSYARCLAQAPIAHGQDRPDVSRADFTWCLTAIDWGFSVEATAARLMEESPKARESGERYAMLTATNAAAAIERRCGGRAGNAPQP